MTTPEALRDVMALQNKAGVTARHHEARTAPSPMTVANLSGAGTDAPHMSSVRAGARTASNNGGNRGSNGGSGNGGGRPQGGYRGNGGGRPSGNGQRRRGGSSGGRNRSYAS